MGMGGDVEGVFALWFSYWQDQDWIELEWSGEQSHSWLISTYS